MLFLIASLILIFIAVGFLLQSAQYLAAAPAEAALVYGTGVEWKARSRWLKAAEIYRRGLARYLIVSGGVAAPGQGLSEAEWFRDRLVSCGIPAEYIILENQARSTYENVIFTLPILQEHGFRSVILVMSDFMTLRSYLTAKKAWHIEGIKIFTAPARSGRHWSPWTWWCHPQGWRVTGHEVRMLYRQGLVRDVFAGNKHEA